MDNPAAGIRHGGDLALHPGADDPEHAQPAAALGASMSTEARSEGPRLRGQGGAQFWAATMPISGPTTPPLSTRYMLEEEDGT